MIEIFTLWLFSDLSGVLVQLFFAYTIILMVLDKQKPPIQTSVLTGLALLALSSGGSFTSSATALMGGLNGFIWLYLGYQRYRQDNSALTT